MMGDQNDTFTFDSVRLYFNIIGRNTWPHGTKGSPQGPVCVQ
jgi:hypothetical protein